MSAGTSDKRMYWLSQLQRARREFSQAGAAAAAKSSMSCQVIFIFFGFLVQKMKHLKIFYLYLVCSIYNICVKMIHIFYKEATLEMHFTVILVSYTNSCLFIFDGFLESLLLTVSTRLPDKIYGRIKMSHL